MKGLAPSAATRADLSGSSRGVGISQQCRRSLSPWTDLAFLRAGVPLEQVSRHTVVTTDASSTGWGATCNGQAASGLWTGPRLLWHINCLELWAVHLALRQFRPLLLGKHVLVRTDNTAAVSYINRLGGIRSHRMSQLAQLWTIGFSERGAAHNCALPRCLSSRRCMRSWRVCGWPLSRPEAARPPPPSSLPSMAEWPGGTRAFPRWRERSRCTCAHKTQPLGGTVRVSRPRPVSWQPLSRPKLTVLRARQPPPCTPWLSCRFTKPRRSNRCTRVVPTRGWCRSCARRLTSLYEWRKSRRGPSGRWCPPWWSRSAISGSTWQRWRTSTRHAFSTPPSPREGCSATPSRASPSSSRRYSNRPRRSSTSCPGVMHHPLLPPGPGLSLPVAVGALLRPPELLRPRPNRHIGRCVEPLAGERRPPRPSQAPSRPGSRRSGPDAGNPEMLEFALSQETARAAENSFSEWEGTERSEGSGMLIDDPL